MVERGDDAVAHFDDAVDTVLNDTATHIRDATRAAVLAALIPRLCPTCTARVTRGAGAAGDTTEGDTT